ncbi:MAG TPA: alcohol dehydrogenase catalytic domain-containing protein [Solirubrobacteraceae bacterium]|nr:alcohol dehydrogenase catalytic domain-containing protein [Solirubrobacteraceae bacterium]
MTKVSVLELERPGRARLVERELPAAGALLRVQMAGVCGTDRHIFGGRLPVQLPRALGHEVIGRLERVGPASGIALDEHVREGARVVLAPGVPCGACAGCAAGGHCEDRRVYGIDMPGDGPTGGFSPLLTLSPGTRLFALQDGIQPERAIFAETMACVLSGLRKALGPGAELTGSQTLVIGFGSIGVCAAVALHSLGASVAVLEHDPRRRALARELEFLDVHASHAELGLDAALYGRTRSFAVVVDAAGTPGAFSAGLELLGRAGTLLELGNFADLGRASVSPSDICQRDLRVVGSGETLYEDFTAAVALVADTPIELARAVTDVHEFASLTNPNELLGARPAGKAVITFP